MREYAGFKLVRYFNYMFISCLVCLPIAPISAIYGLILWFFLLGILPNLIIFILNTEYKVNYKKHCYNDCMSSAKYGETRFLHLYYYPQTKREINHPDKINIRLEEKRNKADELIKDIAEWYLGEYMKIEEVWCRVLVGLSDDTAYSQEQCLQDKKALRQQVIEKLESRRNEVLTAVENE